jgi:ribosomal protein S18 acetylase RimI-like enzyme
MIERATENDLTEILRLQKLAFKEEADFVGNLDIPPMTQTLEDLKFDFTKMTFLKYVEGGMILGSVRAFEDAGTCHIKRMIVHPNYWGKGIGKSLIKEIERVFNHAKRYELYTRIDNKRTRLFYNSLGYKPFRTEKVTDTLTCVYLEKWNSVND